MAGRVVALVSLLTGATLAGGALTVDADGGVGVEGDASAAANAAAAAASVAAWLPPDLHSDPAALHALGSGGGCELLELTPTQLDRDRFESGGLFQRPFVVRGGAAAWPAAAAWTRANLSRADRAPGVVGIGSSSEIVRAGGEGARHVRLADALAELRDHHAARATADAGDAVATDETTSTDRGDDAPYVFDRGQFMQASGLARDVEPGGPAWCVVARGGCVSVARGVACVCGLSACGRTDGRPIVHPTRTNEPLPTVALLLCCGSRCH